MWSPTHVQVTVQRAKGLLTKGKNKTNDCFVTIALGKEKYQTSVKEKASKDVEWHEECELAIPEQGNTAEIVLTALHRNFLGVDEFLGTVSIPLASFDVYERPKNRWYTLCSKPGKENTKDRGELEVRIGFIVKAGSLTDLTRKERHKSSLGQLSTAAQSIGGSLLSIGSIEKRKGLKKLAKSIGNRVKGKSKNKLNKENLDEREEENGFRATSQEPGEADPGVISEDEDEFTFDDLSHKSSASSLNAPAVATVNGTKKSNSVTSVASAASFGRNNVGHEQQQQQQQQQQTAPVTPANVAPNKPPRFATSSSTSSLSKIDNQKEEDEWGLKLYGKQSNAPKRWESTKLNNPKILVDEPKDDRSDLSPTHSPSPSSRFRDTSEPPSPAPREIIQHKINKDEKPALIKDKFSKENNLKDKREEKFVTRSPREEKNAKKDKKNKEKENKTKEIKEEKNRPSSSERIIIGGEDAFKGEHLTKHRLSHEILSQFDGKSREDLIELTLQLQAEVADKKKRMVDLEDYIDSLLLRVIECSPRLLQNPFQTQRRLSSPGHQ
ncbi:rab11 family-interacting protein 1-like isoform X2 [Vespa mandarinia]|uniref:rab11 family-interacting protein 1-like isoform X2 n=1 Tax=Vespa mandarinia TaxID=7446 RepID=UPI0016111878|nr:rab11 family-interacting protein 1-like isoform X2 [Vespa mandarinia]